MEEIGRKRSEREDRRVECHTEHRDEPERRIEFLDVRNFDLVACRLVFEVQHVLSPAVEHDVDQVRQQRDATEEHRGPERHPEIAEVLRNQLFGIEAEQGSQPADRERNTKGERKFLSFEPPADDRALSNDKRFRAPSKHEPASVENPEVRRNGNDGGTKRDQSGEKEARLPRPDAVDKHAPDEDRKNGGNAVERIHLSDGFAPKAKRFDQRGRNGPDTVIGEVTSKVRMLTKRRTANRKGAPAG